MTNQKEVTFQENLERLLAERQRQFEERMDQHFAKQEELFKMQTDSVFAKRERLFEKQINEHFLEKERILQEQMNSVLTANVLLTELRQNLSSIWQEPFNDQKLSIPTIPESSQLENHAMSSQRDTKRIRLRRSQSFNSCLSSRCKSRSKEDTAEVREAALDQNLQRKRCHSAGFVRSRSANQLQTVYRTRDI